MSEARCPVYAREDEITVFGIAGEGGCGSAFPESGRAMLCDISIIGDYASHNGGEGTPYLFSHELGHYLGMRHIFDLFGGAGGINPATGQARPVTDAWDLIYAPGTSSSNPHRFFNSKTDAVSIASADPQWPLVLRSPGLPTLVETISKSIWRIGRSRRDERCRRIDLSDPLAATLKSLRGGSDRVGKKNAVPGDLPIGSKRATQRRALSMGRGGHDICSPALRSVRRSRRDQIDAPHPAIVSYPPQCAALVDLRAAFSSTTSRTNETSA